MSYYPATNSRSPPPLQHPVPTHPAYIPEPPSTPASPQGYQRYTSSPSQAAAQQQQGYPQPIPPASNAPPYMGQGGQGGGGQYPPPQQQPGPMPPRGQIPTVPIAPADFAAWGINETTAQFGMQLGQSAVAAGQDYVQKNVRLFLCTSTAINLS